MSMRAMKVVRPKTDAKRDPDGVPDESATVTANAIAIRAYELWQQRGSPIGSPEIDWHQAENELKKGSVLYE
jgi:hypothetical protein